MLRLRSRMTCLPIGVILLSSTLSTTARSGHTKLSLAGKDLMVLGILFSTFFLQGHTRALPQNTSTLRVRILLAVFKGSQRPLNRLHDNQRHMCFLIEPVAARGRHMSSSSARHVSCLICVCVMCVYMCDSSSDIATRYRVLLAD